MERRSIDESTATRSGLRGERYPACAIRIGAIDVRANQLRDPDIHVDLDGAVYMPYSVAGEAGIALAKVETS